MKYPYVEFGGYRYFPSIRFLKSVVDKNEVIRVGVEDLPINFERAPCTADSFSVLLYVGSCCNFDCRYCFKDSRNEYNVRCSDLETLVRVLGIKKLFLLGGEVVFYADRVLELLSAAVSAGVDKVVIYTNGISADEDLMGSILSFGCALDFIVTVHPENFPTFTECKGWYDKVLDVLSAFGLHTNYAYMLCPGGVSVDWLDDFVVHVGNKVTSLMIYPVLSLAEPLDNANSLVKVQQVLGSLLLTAMEVNRWYAIWDRDIIFQTLSKRKCLYDRLYLDDKGFVYGCVAGCSENLRWSSNELICHVNDINPGKVRSYQVDRSLRKAKAECSECIGNIACYFESCPYVECTDLVRSVCEFYGIGTGLRVIQKWLYRGKVDAGEVQFLL